MWQFAKSCEGIKEACERLNTPVVSGNVSLYNETNGVSVFPTPAIAMVGLNSDARKSLPFIFSRARKTHIIFNWVRQIWTFGWALWYIKGSYFGGRLVWKEDSQKN